jgi:hypothetical protein
MTQSLLAKKGGGKLIMKFIKIVAALAIAAGAFSLGACASKPAPVTPAPSFSK